MERCRGKCMYVVAMQVCYQAVSSLLSAQAGVPVVSTVNVWILPTANTISSLVMASASLNAWIARNVSILTTLFLALWSLQLLQVLELRRALKVHEGATIWYGANLAEEGQCLGVKCPHVACGQFSALYASQLKHGAFKATVVLECKLHRSSITLATSYIDVMRAVHPLQTPVPSNMQKHAPQTANEESTVSDQHSLMAWMQNESVMTARNTTRAARLVAAESKDFKGHCQDDMSRLLWALKRTVSCVSWIGSWEKRLSLSQGCTIYYLWVHFKHCTRRA